MPREISVNLKKYHTSNFHSGGIFLEPSHYEELEDFAEMYGFRFDPEARELLESYRLTPGQAPRVSLAPPKPTEDINNLQKNTGILRSHSWMIWRIVTDYAFDKQAPGLPGECGRKIEKRSRWAPCSWEQGTGKTITALELLPAPAGGRKVTHIPWLCPCSTKQNLKDELIKQSPGKCLRKLPYAALRPTFPKPSCQQLSPAASLNGKPATSWWMKAFLLKILRLQDTEHRPAVLTVRIQADSQRHAHFQNQADLYAQFHVPA